MATATAMAGEGAQGEAVRRAEGARDRLDAEGLGGPGHLVGVGPVGPRADDEAHGEALGKAPAQAAGQELAPRRRRLAAQLGSLALGGAIVVPVLSLDRAGARPGVAAALAVHGDGLGTVVGAAMTTAWQGSPAWASGSTPRSARARKPDRGGPSSSTTRTPAASYSAASSARRWSAAMPRSRCVTAHAMSRGRSATACSMTSGWPLTTTSTWRRPG